MNLISFDTLINSWKSSLVEVNEETLRGARTWVKELVCHGTTNTLGALETALKDKQTKAVYLLTDGRPDHVCITITYILAMLTCSAVLLSVGLCVDSARVSH